METRSSKFRKGPLPEERRGTSVAGDGRDRMLASDSQLVGWAGVRDGMSQGITARLERSEEDSRSSRSSCSRAPTPAEDVSQEAPATQPATTKAGKPRVRMKWSDEINLFIMRTYFYVTKLETDRTMYCKKLHDQFSQKYPDLKVSAQRVADQRRVIIRNNLLTDDVINTLRREVSEQLKREEADNIDLQVIESITNATLTQQIDADQLTCHVIDTLTQNTSTLVPTSTQQTTFTQNNDRDFSIHDISTQTSTYPRIVTITEQIHQEQNTLQVDNNVTTQELTDQLHTTLIKYSGTDPIARPKLPKLKESRKLFELLGIFNRHILGKFFNIDSDINAVHTLIYCSAFVISETLGYKIGKPNVTNRQQKPIKPAWQIRIETDIRHLRADIGRLSQYINNNRSRRVVTEVENIFRKHKVHTSHEKDNMRPEEFLDTLKQKLTLKSKRLARYTKALRRKEDNKQFARNEKEFYRTLKGDRTATSNNRQIPQEDELKSYWANLWKKQQDHKESADWLSNEANRLQNTEEMELQDITRDDIETITTRLKNWKAAGVDSVHNFWYKKFIILHEILAKNISDLIKGNQELPTFITKGITFMLPKSTDTANPSQYRPITCLPTIYKLITSCITLKINNFLHANNILSEEQKGCRQYHKGCKEQLIIDSTVLKHASTHKRNLHISYIDYKKAFDSVPHSWLIRILELYKISTEIINFLKNAMSTWRTTLCLSNGTTTVNTDEIRIENGIFQGDSLSPLWFCLTLNPLSQLLNSSNNGYKLNTDTSITHLMYMDDIKLFAKSRKDLQHLLDITAQYSSDINMTFGLDKCKTLHIQRGKLENTPHTPEPSPMFSQMEPKETYKYLGIHQSNNIDHIQLKKKLTEEYSRRLNLICKKQLYSKNLFKAINTFAIPILTYSFGTIKWTRTDINRLEIKTRTTLNKHSYLHPKSAIERISIKRQEGGRGLIDLNILWEGQIKNLRNFFFSKCENSELHSAIVDLDNNYTPLNLNNREIQYTSALTHKQDKFNRWRSKELHGRHLHDLEQDHVDKVASNKWLKLGSLFPETEGFMIAIQDQVINTKNYKKFIFKDRSIQSDKCRKCHRASETIQHITSACPSLTQTDYTHRHNQIVNIVHQKLAHKHNLLNTKAVPYYQYTPKPVLENQRHKMYYDRAILTDRTVHNNRPDITLIDKTIKQTYLIDIAVPNTHNLQKTITDKIHKYTELKEEIIRLWNMNRVSIVPLVLSSTGVIPKHLLHYLKQIDLDINIYMTMQKAAVLNTCRIVRKFLQDDLASENNTQSDLHLA